VRAGAIIEEDTGDMKVKEETTSVAAHFFLIDQFLGFPGSSGPSHVTKFGSSESFSDGAECRGLLFSFVGCASRSLSNELPRLGLGEDSWRFVPDIEGITAVKEDM